MNIVEALKKYKRVEYKGWPKSAYIYLDKDGTIMDECYDNPIDEIEEWILISLRKYLRQ